MIEPIGDNNITNHIVDHPTDNRNGMGMRLADDIISRRPDQCQNPLQMPNPWYEKT